MDEKTRAIWVDNQSWIIEAGEAVDTARRERGYEALSDVERLIHVLWLVEYAMSDSGDMDKAASRNEDFLADGRHAAAKLGLARSMAAFSLSQAEFEACYYEVFVGLCDEARSALRRSAS